MKKTIEDFDLNNKRVIIRVDFNVPIKDGIIIDDNRIRESLKTINYAIDHNAKVILLSHLGRIKNESDKEKNSLRIVATRLSELLKRNVIFISETRGPEVEKIISNMNNKDVVLLENTRYEDLPDKKESTNNQELAAYWASLGDIFINDAFGTIHRSHASNVGIASILPSGIGFLVANELDALKTLDEPVRPYIVILGGAKVSDKLGVINNLIKKADKIIIGGAMAFTFLKAKGLNIGKSLVEDDYLSYCKDLMINYPNKLVLPIDVVVSNEISVASSNKTVSINNICDNEIGLDLGKETIDIIKNDLKDAKTVVWNGPLGYYEIPAYQTSTKEILKYLTENNINTILGGGDIVAASSELGYKDKVTHASTGGGATLEYLEGKVLPGLKIINEK
ncbi:MAG: phosphoglycerate kinase [Tenericutes bacterium]|nr:phosphoglycerate kinase [Mycoplasmatota bacterium]